MMKFRPSLLFAATVTAGCLALFGCGTGTGAADSAASTPATSHYKADLAIGYSALAAVDIGATNALKAGAITQAQAIGVRSQRQAFKSALDSLAAAGEASGNQSTLTATLAAITAAQAFLTVQGAQK